MKYILVLVLLPLNGFAQMTENDIKICFEAFAKQSGIDKEIERTGTFLYRKIPKNMRKKLDITATLVDTIISQQINVRYEFQ